MTRRSGPPFSLALLSVQLESSHHLMQLEPARAQISPSRSGQICEIRMHLLSATSNAPLLQRKYGTLGSEALAVQLFSILTHTREPELITRSEKTEPEVYRPDHALVVLPYLPKAPIRTHRQKANPRVNPISACPSGY